MVRNMPDLPKESASARYRRLAQECLENRAHLSGRGKADRSATDRASLAAAIGRTKDGSATATAGPAQRRWRYGL